MILEEVHTRDGGEPTKLDYNLKPQGADRCSTTDVYVVRHRRICAIDRSRCTIDGSIEDPQMAQPSVDRAAIGRSLRHQWIQVSKQKMLGD